MLILFFFLLLSNVYADSIDKVDDNNILVTTGKTVSIEDLKNDYISAQNARDYYQSRMNDIELQINEAAIKNVNAAIEAKTILE